MWVRDDGKITLIAPSATVGFIVLGVVVLLGLGVLSFFSFRTSVRAVDKQLAAERT